MKLRKIRRIFLIIYLSSVNCYLFRFEKTLFIYGALRCKLVLNKLISAQDIQNYVDNPIEEPHSPSPIHDSDRQILTVDDVCRLNQGLDTQVYDAFVAFAEEDIDFATELIETMEKQYGFKLCVKERDLIAGLAFEHKAIVELIAERCNRLIVILSPAFIKSSANRFVVNYAQALGIGTYYILQALQEATPS